MSISLFCFLSIGCTDGIENKEDLSSPIRWKAILKIADKEIPLIFKLDSVPLNAYGYRAIFVAIQTQEPRFPQTSTMSKYNPTGSWAFRFLPATSSPNLDLYYKLSQIKISQTDHLLVGRANYQQGFEGVFTADGFVLSSFSRDEPILLEATFLNEQEIEGKIYAYQEVIPFQATKRSPLVKTKEDSSNIILTLFRLLKFHNEYPE